MARINLLPWRAELRKKRQRDFIAAVGVFAGFSVVLVVLTYFYYSAAIDTQLKRNAFMEAEIAEVDAKIAKINELEKAKRQLVDRMKVIERLQQGRSEIVHVFDEIVKAVPDGLYLNSISQKGEILTLEGVAQSNARVSQLMHNLDDSPWFDTSRLDIIDATDNKVSDRRKFKLIVPQTAQTAQTTEDPKTQAPGTEKTAQSTSAQAVPQQTDSTPKQ